MQLHRQFKRGPGRRSALAAALLCAVLAACSPTLEKHGHMPDPEILKSVRVGQTNRDQVREMLGTPSAVAAFDDETWYYIGSRTSQVAFLDPKLLERKVVAIHFDKQGVVRQVEKLDKNDGRNVQIVQRKTPTRGRELTILEQLIGNIGRFGGGESDSGDIPGGPGT